AKMYLENVAINDQERLIFMGLNKGILVKAGIRKRCWMQGQTLQRKCPIADGFLGWNQAGHLQLLQQGNARRAVANEPVQVLGDRQSVPALSAGAVAGISKIARLQADPRSFTRVGTTRLKRPPPIVGVSMKLLMNLGPTFLIVETIINFQSQLAPSICGLVVASDWTNCNRMGRISVGGFLSVSVLQRQANQSG